MQIAGERGSALLERDNTPSGRILVVDGDESIVETIAAILRHDGFEVATARSHHDAESLLQATPFDMLLIDVRSDDPYEHLLD